MTEKGQLRSLTTMSWFLCSVFVRIWATSLWLYVGPHEHIQSGHPESGPHFPGYVSQTQPTWSIYASGNFFFNHLKQNDLSEVTFVMISNIFYLWLNPKIKNKKYKSAELSKWKRTRRLSALPHEQEPSVGWEFVRPRWPDCNLIISPLSDGGRCSGFSFPVVSTEATNTRSCNDVINGSESDDYVTYMDFFL